MRPNRRGGLSISRMAQAERSNMSWLPKRDKLDPVQASAVDFVVAQEGNFYIKGEAGTGKSVELAHVAAKLAASARHAVPV